MSAAVSAVLRDRLKFVLSYRPPALANLTHEVIGHLQDAEAEVVERDALIVERDAQLDAQQKTIKHLRTQLDGMPAGEMRLRSALRGHRPEIGRNERDLYAVIDDQHALLILAATHIRNEHPGDGCPDGCGTCTLIRHLDAGTARISTTGEPA